MDPWLLFPIEFDPLETWLLAELDGDDDDEDELEPPEEPLCELPALDELLELAETLGELLLGALAALPEPAPAAPADVCWAERVETNRITAMTRPESFIQHLLADSGEPDNLSF